MRYIDIVFDPHLLDRSPSPICKQEIGLKERPPFNQASKDNTIFKGKLFNGVTACLSLGFVQLKKKSVSEWSNKKKTKGQTGKTSCFIQVFAS